MSKHIEPSQKMRTTGISLVCVGTLMAATVLAASWAQSSAARTLILGPVSSDMVLSLHRNWNRSGAYLPGGQISVAISASEQLSEPLSGMIPTKPQTSFVVSIASGTMAIGRVNTECKSDDRAWRCTTAGASIVVLPLTECLAFPAGLIAAGAVLLVLAARARNANRRGHCRGCGYCLYGLQSERCPECGIPFS